MPRGWYPKSASIGDQYVYLQTLSSDNGALYKQAKDLLSVLDANSEFIQSQKFSDTIIKIRMVAQSEKAKEIAFIKQKMPNAQVDINSDFKDIIKQINDAILGQGELQNRIAMKKSEIENYKKGTGSWSYTQALGSYIEKALNQIYGVGSKKSSKDSLSMAVTRELTNMIIHRVHGFQITEIAGLVGIIQSQIMPALNTQSENLLDTKGKFNLNKVRTAISKQAAYQDKFAKDSIQDAQEIARQAISLFGQTTNQDKLQKVQNKITKAQNMLTAIAQKNQHNLTDLEKLLVQDTSLENLGFDLSFERNTGFGGEARAMQDLGANLAKIVGGKGGKSDVISFQLGQIHLKQKQSIVENALDKIESFVSKESQSNVAKTAELAQEVYDSLEKEIYESKKALLDLEKSFIIHGSVKDYVTAGTSDFSGFKGGEYVGVDLIKAITSLPSDVFSTLDTNWLITCAINTADEAIGASMKTNLERYLSLFAVFLLYDDGATMIMDMVNKVAQEKSINVLHLFSLNGIFVPTSFILEEIAASLENSFINGVESSPESYVNVSIDPGNIDFQGLLEELNQTKHVNSQGEERTGIYGAPRWRAVSDRELSVLKMRVHFLKSFKTILDNLS